MYNSTTINMEIGKRAETTKSKTTASTINTTIVPATDQSPLITHYLADYDKSPYFEYLNPSFNADNKYNITNIDDSPYFNTHIVPTNYASNKYHYKSKNYKDYNFLLPDFRTSVCEPVVDTQKATHYETFEENLSINDKDMLINEKEEIEDIKKNEENMTKFYSDNFNKLLKEGKITELTENKNKDKEKNMTHDKCMINELNKVDPYNNFPDFDYINQKCNKYNYYNFDINEGFKQGGYLYLFVLILIIIGIIGIISF